MAHARVGYGAVGIEGRFSKEKVSISYFELFKFSIICIVLFTTVSVFHVWSRCKSVEMNLQISEAGKQLKEVEQEQKRLKLEVASLKTPARIEAIAKNELGMVLPTGQQIVNVK